MSVFAERLKEMRTQRGYTSQEAFAKVVGLDRVTINFYENDKRRPDINTLKKISDSLDCSCDYLLGTDKYEKKGTEELRKLFGLNEVAANTLIMLNKQSQIKSSKFPYGTIDTLNYLLEQLSLNIHLDEKDRHDLLSMINLYIIFEYLPSSKKILATEAATPFNSLKNNTLRVIMLEINDELKKIKDSFEDYLQNNKE